MSTCFYWMTCNQDAVVSALVRRDGKLIGFALCQEDYDRWVKSLAADGGRAQLAATYGMVQS